MDALTVIGPEKAAKRRSHRPSSTHAAWVVLMTMTMTACSASPSRNILGSYFPTWMVCALLAIVIVIVIRIALVKTGVDAVMPAPVVVYLCMWTAATLAIWLVWLG
jgi:hypothetical protein